jgi:hypothetical protein
MNGNIGSQRIACSKEQAILQRELGAKSQLTETRPVDADVYGV